MADFTDPLRTQEATIRLLEQGDGQTVDVVRPAPGRFYAYIDDLDLEKGRGKLYRLEMMLYCFFGDWFDQLREDLSDMPPINTIGQVARACALEVIVREQDFRDLRTKTESVENGISVDFEAVHLSEGWWLEVTITTEETTDGYPIAIYLPADGSTDPATIGNTPNEIDGRLMSIERVRPPSRLIKLQRFSHSSL